MSDYYEQAVEKLKKENAALSGNRYIEAMKDSVRDALLEFCGQDEEFAQAIVQGGSFEDCMKSVAKGVGGSISDIEAYRRAVSFYFLGAVVHFKMEINLCSSVDTKTDGPAPRKDGILVSLDSFF